MLYIVLTLKLNGACAAKRLILTAWAFVHALRTAACIRLATCSLRAYGPSLNAAAMLDGLELLRAGGIKLVGLILVSLLVCLVCRELLALMPRRSLGPSLRSDSNNKASPAA